MTLPLFKPPILRPGAAAIGLLSALVLGAVLAAAPAPARAQTFPVTVESCGQTLTFKAPPQRAVIHDLNMTDMALALGLQPQMVGVTGITGWYKVGGDFRQRLGGVPELAPKQPPLETLLAARPDFFFAGWNYGLSVGGPVTPQRLAEFGIPTLLLSESCIHVDKQRPVASMELLYGDLLKLGTVFGREKRAQDLVAGWKSRLARLPQPAPGVQPLRVFVFDSGEDKPFTAGRYAMPDALIRAAGGVNVMHDLPTSWGTTAWETVAARNPQFLILLDYQRGTSAQGLMRFLRAHPAMRQTDAVRHGRFIPLRYEELTPGPANIGAIEKLSKALAGVRGSMPQ